MIKVIIVEDEPTAARRLQKLLAESGFDILALEILDSVKNTAAYLQYGEKPDLILLDIHLADGSSFELFKMLDIDIPVIFTTAYDAYAIDAFKVNSIDYLLKPVRREELIAALQKFARNQPAFLVQDAIKNLVKSSVNQYQKRFVVKSGTQLKAVEVDHIAVFYAEDKVVMMRTFNGHTFIVDFSLDKLETMLIPSMFYRINRKMIINERSIKKISTYFKGKLKIELQIETPFDVLVSAEKVSAFKSWLETGDRSKS